MCIKRRRVLHSQLRRTMKASLTFTDGMTLMRNAEGIRYARAFIHLVYTLFAMCSKHRWWVLGRYCSIDASSMRSGFAAMHVKVKISSVMGGFGLYIEHMRVCFPDFFSYIFFLFFVSLIQWRCLFYLLALS